jgi:alpha-L-rhamnosidase
MTPYGRVSSAWKLDGQAFELAVEVPPNTTATVRLPGARLADVKEAGQALAAAMGLAAPRQEGADVVVEAGSGLYRFAYTSAK